jgi:DNA-nicking Smr family endonuclease
LLSVLISGLTRLVAFIDRVLPVLFCAGRVLYYGLCATEGVVSKISKSDAEHFRSAMQNVRPLKADERHYPPTPERAGSKRRRAELGDSVAPIKTGGHENLAALVADACEQSRALCRHGVHRKALRLLGSAQIPVNDSLDLHGMTENMASKALHRFLADSLADGLRCIRVVHGKGLGSQGRAVLKLMSWQQMWQHPGVLALKPCAPQDGGSGAVLVMLRSSRSAPV